MYDDVPSRRREHLNCRIDYLSCQSSSAGMTAAGSASMAASSKRYGVKKASGVSASSIVGSSVPAANQPLLFGTVPRGTAVAAPHSRSAEGHAAVFAPLGHTRHGEHPGRLAGIDVADPAVKLGIEARIERPARGIPHGR